LTRPRISSNLPLGGYDLPLAPFGDGKCIAAFVALCPNERASNASLWQTSFCLVQAKDADMRDFRNAKAMAQTLRAALAARSVKISVSQSLELVSEMFGVADWNTLAAIIRTDKSVSPERVSAAVPAAGEGNPVLPVSADLAATRERAIRFATQQKHEYATLEHLLLSLIEDADASAAMSVYNVDHASLKGKLVDHLDNNLGILVIDNGWDTKPTAAFQRVFQRAQHRALELGHSTITGANILEAISFETQSPAARLLAEQGITRRDILNLIAHGKGWYRVQQSVQEWSKRRSKDST
jgi:GTP:adenosylcobinamide-phosphate guanylyltransferase